MIEGLVRPRDDRLAMRAEDQLGLVLVVAPTAKGDVVDGAGGPGGFADFLIRFRTDRPIWPWPGDRRQLRLLDLLEQQSRGLDDRASRGGARPRPPSPARPPPPRPPP